jgi:hypothetical protein
MASSDAKNSKCHGGTWTWGWWYAHARTNSSNAGTCIKNTLPHLSLLQNDNNATLKLSECATAWHAPTDATTNEEWRGNSRNDENFNAKSGWGSNGLGGNATHDEPGRWFGRSRGIGWRNAKYE